MKEKSKGNKVPEAFSVYAAINKARGLTLDAVGQIMNSTGVPPYVMDGILSSILAEIRQKEMYDLGVVYSSLNETNNTEDGDGEHKRTADDD